MFILSSSPWPIPAEITPKLYISHSPSVIGTCRPEYVQRKNSESGANALKAMSLGLLKGSSRSRSQWGMARGAMATQSRSKPAMTEGISRGSQRSSVPKLTFFKSRISQQNKVKRNQNYWIHL